MSAHTPAADFTYIDSNAALEEMCSHLSHCKRIALDTEFIHKKTYFAKLALIQLGAHIKVRNKNKKQVYLIDPLTLTQPAPLIALLGNPNIEKIMHSPQQDREVLIHTYQVNPQPIFDTQLAVAFLGCNEQIGYQRLVADKFGQTIDKSCTVSDWLMRPLSEKQLIYAVEDILYLDDLYVLLKNQLRQTRKIRWFEEESRLRQNETYDYPKQFLRGIEHAPKDIFKLYQQLMRWREKKARQKNLPRQWIMSNLCIKNIVTAYRQNPRLSQRAIEQSITRKRQAKPRVTEYAKDIHTLISNLDPKLVSLKNKTKPAAYKKELQALSLALINIAEQANIAPALIANRYDLIKLAKGERCANLFDNWRRHLAKQLVGTLA